MLGVKSIVSDLTDGFLESTEYLRGEEVVLSCADPYTEILLLYLSSFEGNWITTSPLSS